MSSRHRFAAESAACLLASLLCAAVLRGQEAPVTQAPPRRAAPAAVKPSTEANGGGVYASKKKAAPPPQMASGARPARGGAFNQFVPQPRRPPQATWGFLTPEQEAQVDQVLQAWEKKSAQVKTLQCNFVMWQYIQALSNDPTQPARVSKGLLMYAAPDKGHYRITEEAVDPTQREPQFQKKDGEHWVCDGNAVYEFNREQKKLYERRLPAELKGKAISNSPLPFVFGTTASQMRQRYWMRVTTPRQLVGKEVWLKIEPMFAEDRANYREAMVILDEKQMLPKALSLLLPSGGRANGDRADGDRTNYAFETPYINNPLKKFLGGFDVPATPSGWKRIVEEAPPADAPPPQVEVQTLRLKGSTKRK